MPTRAGWIVGAIVVVGLVFARFGTHTEQVVGFIAAVVVGVLLAANGVGNAYTAFSAWRRKEEIFEEEAEEHRPPPLSAPAPYDAGAWEAERERRRERPD